MHKSSLVLIGAAALCLSCAPPKSAAFVDLDKVLANELRPVREIALEGVVGGNEIAGTMTLDPVSGKIVGDGLARERLAEARAFLAENRTKALQNLEDRLNRAYRREIDRYRAEKEFEMEGEYRRLVEQTLDGLTTILSVYAEDRWPVANRLAFLVGYPFPPESRLVAPDDSDPIKLRYYNESKQLYAKLAELERQYQQSVDEMFNELSASDSERRQKLGLEILNQIDQFEKQAREEAAQTLANLNEEIDLVLLDAGLVPLSALPGSNITIVAPSVKGENGGTLKPRAIISLRERIESELRIWLDVNRLTYSEAGKDMTRSFMEWRNENQDGR